MIKINVDATWDAHSTFIRMGIVAQDNQGSFVFARAIKFPIDSVLTAQLIALREASKVTLKWGFSNSH